MRTRNGFVAAALMGFASTWAIGCTGPQTRSETVKSDNLSHYKTYQWLTQQEADAMNLQNPETPYLTERMTIETRPMIEQQVRAQLERNLNAQGFQEDITGAPDFYVTYYAPTRDPSVWQSSWSGRTSSRYNIPIAAYPHFDVRQPFHYREGMVFIVMYDSRTREPSWQGTINDVVNQDQVNSPQLEANVSKLIADFKQSTNPSA